MEKEIVNLPLFGVRDVFHLCQRNIMYDENSKSREESKDHESSQNAKQDDICDIIEELFAVHVVARGEDNWRKNEVEEEIVIELHDVREFARAFEGVYSGD